MPSQQVVLSIIEAEQAAGNMLFADNLYTAIFNGGPESWKFVNQYGAVVASITGAFRLLRPFNIQANTFAMTTSFLSIQLDIQNGRQIQVGDVLSLVGSLSGIVATGIALAGVAPSLGVVLSITAIVVNTSSVMVGTNFTNITNWVREVSNTYWNTLPLAQLKDMNLDYPNPLKTTQQKDMSGWICWRWESTKPAPERVPCPKPPDPDEKGTDGDSNGT